VSSFAGPAWADENVLPWRLPLKRQDSRILHNRRVFVKWQIIAFAKVFRKAERVRCPRAGRYGPFPGGVGHHVCRHYDRHARCSLQPGPALTGVTRRPWRLGAALREAWSDAEPLGCASPLGKSRGGTPSSERVPSHARRIARCGGFGTRLPAFRLPFLFVVPVGKVANGEIAKANGKSLADKFNRSFPRKRESRLGPRFRGDERRLIRYSSVIARSEATKQSRGRANKAHCCIRCETELDCFASLAMTGLMRQHPRTTRGEALCRSRFSCLAFGARRQGLAGAAAAAAAVRALQAGERLWRGRAALVGGVRQPQLRRHGRAVRRRQESARGIFPAFGTSLRCAGDCHRPHFREGTASLAEVIIDWHLDVPIGFACFIQNPREDGAAEPRRPRARHCSTNVAAVICRATSGCRRRP